MSGSDILPKPVPGEAAHASDDVGLRSLAGPGSIMLRTARGAGWVVGWRMTTRLLGVFSTLMLVRLLTPADFGIVALAMSFLQGLNSLAEVGVEEAIIRADRLDRSVYDAGFTINVIRNTLSSIIIVILAVPISHFFGNKHLVPVILALGAGWFITGFDNIGMVDFRRFLAFQMEFKIKILPRLASVAVAIPVAYFWHSYWALVGAILTGQTLTFILSYVMHPYRPRFGFAGMKYIAQFSFWTWVNSLITLIGGRVAIILLGRLFGAAAVGIYSLGIEVGTLASAEVVAPMCRALFPGFAAVRQEGGNGADPLLRALSVMALITFPMSFGLSLVAYPIIELGFGKQWLGAAPIIELVGVFSSLGLFGSIAAMLFAAHAWLKTTAWMNTAVMIFRSALILILVPRYGLMGAAYGAVAGGLLLQSIYLVTSVRRLAISPWAIARRVGRPIIAASVMAGLLVWLHLGWTPWTGATGALSLRLAGTVALGAAAYIVSLLGLWQLAGRPEGGETEFLALLTKLMPRKALPAAKT